MDGHQPRRGTEGNLMHPEDRYLVIRADADTRMGTGHVMRCLALAQGWQARGGQAVFVSACDSDGLLQRLRNEAFRVVELEETYPYSQEWEATSQVLTAHPDAWVVLDGYHFDPAYQRRIRLAGHPLLVIDDMAHLDHYCADMVVNQNIYAEQLDYSCEADTRLLLGTRYALLRREFWPWRQWEREIPEVARKLLVTLGGADPDNQTLKVVRALQELRVGGLEATVVIGASNPYCRALESAIGDSAASLHSQLAIQLVRNVTNMPELMARADVAVTAGGSTCWETAFMGLPNLILVLAENQREVAEGLATQGVAVNLGSHTEVGESGLVAVLGESIHDRARRETMSENGRDLVDGAGVHRVAAALNREDAESDLRVRPARWEDTDLLWQWANDPAVRANSFHPEPIPRDEHIEWYKAKLASPETRIWILEFGQVPVAQVRYDCVDGRSAEIDLSVARGYRGEGLGTTTLILTSDMACQQLGVKCLKGVVLSTNTASSRAFTRAGFRCVELEQLREGRLCDIYIRECAATTEGAEDERLH
jgi:UDP-2,4-diacetamido-2,4,6-trideoxy-beta-L-altropyranose hydrolase